MLVIGGEAIGAIIRKAQTPGEFRSNVHLGGKAQAFPLTPEIKVLAEKGAKALKLDIAGVDILQSQSGPVISEINSSPGLEAFSQVNPGAPDQLLDFLLEKIK